MIRTPEGSKNYQKKNSNGAAAVILVVGPRILPILHSKLFGKQPQTGNSDFVYFAATFN